MASAVQAFSAYQQRPFRMGLKKYIHTPINPSIFHHAFIIHSANTNPQISTYNSGAMFRALSMRKSHRGGYDQLISESTKDDRDLLSDPKMFRSTTLPANFYGDSPVKLVWEPKIPAKVDTIEKQVKKVSKVHPLFSLFERKSRKKKATAKPEFSRYMQYLKEGGFWDPNSSKPVIY